MKRELERRSASAAAVPADLIAELRQMIDASRHGVAMAVNASLTLLFWHLGQRLRGEVLTGERAEYGKQIVVSVARQLTAEYGNSFDQKQLWRMVQFAGIFPDEQIVVSLTRQLSWTHFVTLIPLKDELKRDFYTEMCRPNWASPASTRPSPPES
jgi:hypothetical protein